MTDKKPTGGIPKAAIRQEGPTTDYPAVYHLVKIAGRMVHAFRVR